MEEGDVITVEEEELLPPILQFSEEEVKYTVPVVPVEEEEEQEADVDVPKIMEHEEEESVPICVISSTQQQQPQQVRRSIIKPRPRSRRSAKLCLFCMYDAVPPESFLFPQDVLGAVNCSSLQRELQSFFIMRQVLDIPSDWIHLQAEENGKGKEFREWFDVCESCFAEVCKAWDLYQMVLSVRSRLKVIKDKLKMKIKDSTKRYRSRIDSELVKEIRKHSRSRRVPKSTPVEDLVFGGSGGAVGAEYFTDEDQDEFVNTRPMMEEDDPLSGPIQKMEGKLRKRFPTKTVCEDRDYSPPNFDENDDGGDDVNYLDDEFIDGGGGHLPPDPADPVWEEKPPKKRIRKDRVRNRSSASPKRKRIRARTSETKKRKRIWKKKPPRWPFRCQLCPAKYKLEGEFTSHKEDHERNQSEEFKQFDCNFCLFPCANLDELETHKYDKHLRSSHSRLMNQKCKKCPFTVQYYYMLEEHVRNEHPDVPEEDCGLVPLLCKICNQQSATVNSAVLHKKLMHPELLEQVQPDPSSLFECEECGEKFASKILLKFHQNGHIRHKKQVLKYTCEVCGKGFKWESRLRMHTPVHSVEREWVCALCGLDFTYKNALVRHNKRYHPEAEENAAESISGLGGAPSSSSSSVVVPDFQCKICKEVMPAALKQRHLKLHRESFEYKCDLCERSYLKQQALRRHQLINHSNGEHNAKCQYCNKEFIHLEYVKCHYKYCRIKNLTKTSVAAAAAAAAEAPEITAEEEEGEAIIVKIDSTSEQDQEQEGSTASATFTPVTETTSIILHWEK